MYTLHEISKKIGANVVGDGSININGIASLSSAKHNQLSYINNNKYLDDLTNTSAGAVITSKDLAKDCKTNALIVDDVYLAFANVTKIFSKQTSYSAGIHPSVIINNSKIATGCNIEKNVSIGNDCNVGPNSFIGEDVVIGNNVHISPNVCILHGCIIGSNVEISSGSVIGSEGFGNARDDNNKWHTIAHLGAVVIGDNVSIGANTTVDRGTIENTEIHSGVRIDNLVHIAHNVIIGQDCAIAGCTGIAGSTTLGKRCLIGGGVGILGHLKICDDTTINATTTVYKSITSPKTYTGIMPIMIHKQWQNVSLWLIKLDKIANYLNIKLKNLKGK